MIVSGGALVSTKAPSVIWRGTPATWDRSVSLWNGNVSYQGIYESVNWVATVVDKLAELIARLPLKVYERQGGDRVEVPTHPYAELLRKPSSEIDPYSFWEWVVKTIEVEGEAFLGKIRDRGGRPVELVPFHPVAMHHEVQSDNTIKWWYDSGNLRIDNIGRSDFLHFRHIGTQSTIRGVSPLRALRATISNDDAARAAQDSFWKRGARPGTALSHPGQLSKPAADRLRLQFDELAAGADNTGRTVVLEEGMKPEILTVSAEEAQYIQSRATNRDEMVARYNMPPPAVHILEHATYSNITAQFRSVYRDTAAPRVKRIESVLEFDLRGGKRRPNAEDDFGSEVYAEFLMDEVLRGDFEERADAYQKAINSAHLTPNEVRKLENRPALPGGDQLFINSTMVPIDFAAEPPEDEPLAPVIPMPVARSLMGRLSRQRSLEDVDPVWLTEGLNGMGRVVTREWALATDLDDLRARIRALAKE